MEVPEPESKPLIPDPTDRVLEALEQAVSVATGADLNSTASGIATGLDAFLDALLPPQPVPLPEDKCDSSVDPEIAAFCAQEELSLATAANKFDADKSTAESGLTTALAAWEQALNQYRFALANADAVLRAGVSAAIEEFKQKDNPDSTSRRLFLYFTMREHVATALQTFETSRASAGATLAGEAGTLISAYITALASISAARTTSQVAEAAAQITFWQSVEQLRDSEG